MQLGQARAGTATRGWGLWVVYRMAACGRDYRKYRQGTCRSGREIVTQESGGALGWVLSRSIGIQRQQRSKGGGAVRYHGSRDSNEEQENRRYTGGTCQN